MTANLLLPVALVGYILGIVTTVLSTVYRWPAARRAVSFIFATTWVLHLAAILHLAVSQRHFPLTNLAEYLLVLGWVVLTLHMYLWFAHKVDVAGWVLPPLAGVMAFAANQLLAEHPQRSVAPADGWFLFHTTVSTLGMAMLGVAFAMSVLYLVQDRALKSKQTLRLLERLPSLQKSDQIGVRALTVGFVLLSLGIFTGIVVNTEVYQRLLVMGPKQIFALLAWLVFAVILAARPLLGFRGRKSAYLTIAGFALGLMTVIGMTI